MRTLAALAAITGFIAAGTGTARANDGDRTQVIVTDVVGDTLMIAGLASDSDKIALAGLTVYLLGPPAIHGYHGRWTQLGVSLGLRVVGPLAIGGIGCAILSDGDKSGDSDKGILGGIDWGCLAGWVIGAGVGMAGTQVFDWTVLSTTEDTSTEARMFTIGVAF